MASKNANVIRLSPRVVRIMGQNPSAMTLDGTCTYLVGTGAQRVLIDTGEGVPAYMSYLTEAAQNVQSLQCILITHWHRDHVGGVEDVRKHFGSDIAVRKLPGGPWKGTNVVPLEQNEVISVEGATIRVVQSPGHTCDHAALVLEEENAIFSGDCVLGAGTVRFACYHDYMKSLDVLRQLTPSIIYPGHGPVIHDACERIDQYITHRKAREQQVYHVVENSKGKGITPLQIVETVYHDVSKDLVLAAAGNVIHCLRKMKVEGLVDVERREGSGPSQDVLEDEYDESNIMATLQRDAQSVWYSTEVKPK
eukprot:PhF_6_TR22329/c0_g1_i1/m.31611